ncbi:hypothetical protein DYJ20_12625 [Brucella melitensis]|nr:hypothetical protein DYJ20_12625 [Brucella melitensis]
MSFMMMQAVVIIYRYWTALDEQDVKSTCFHHSCHRRSHNFPPPPPPPLPPRNTTSFLPTTTPHPLATRHVAPPHAASSAPG